MSDTIDELFALLQSRKNDLPPDSYTAELLRAGSDRILRKIGEETVELLLAAKGEGKRRLVEESADLIYHLLVLLVAHDLAWSDVERELAARRR